MLNFLIRIKTEIWALILLLVVLGISFGVFNSTSVETARQWDIAYGYYFLLILFSFLIVGLLVNFKDILLAIKKISPSRKSLFVLFGIMLFFSLFMFSNISRSHRVLSDETSWESMGLQMYFNQSGGVCNEGVWSQEKLECHVEVNNFKGKALAFVYSIVFIFADPGRDTALFVNYFFYLFSLLFFFLALSIWFKSEALALASTAFLAGMPIYLMQARSASTEVLYIFLFSFLLFFYAAIPSHKVSWKHFMLSVPLLGFFAQTRQETVFAFIPFALYYVSYFRERFYRLPVFTLAVILASWPSINTMAAYRGYDFQGGEHAAHSLANFWYNLTSNIRIMLNFESDSAFGGILKNPFYSSFTLLLFFSTLWLLFRLIFSRKYKRGALLAFLFSFQIFVILFNVSGTFEIDINQRYVLVALPLFAILMALGLQDFLSTLPVFSSKKAAKITLVLALFMSCGLAMVHVSSYKSNMLYYRNKLLYEEDFLNDYLKSFPDSSIFIYARPWQMLASGFSSFSERTFMNWTHDEFLEWMQKSNQNIYIVRGQDGYGEVNLKSRVVGFKTTNQIELILKEYKSERILLENKSFGYPLTIHKIISKKGFSHYSQNMNLSQLENDHVVLEKHFNESIRYDFIQNDSLNEGRVVLESRDTLFLDSLQMKPGLNRNQFLFYMPDGDTLYFQRDLFVKDSNFVLLTDLEHVHSEQAWGALQVNKTVEGRPISLDGEEFRYGLGVHAYSKNTFKLEKNFEWLEATIGLDDESACGDGAVFNVYTDGVKRYQSLKLYSRDKQKIWISVSGASSLDLVVDEGENMDCDHAVWANAWLRRVNK